MQINIKWTNINHTEDLEGYIREKIGELSKYIIETNGTIEAFVEVGRTTLHHQSGDIFRAECNIRLPKRLLRAEAESADVNLAINEIRDILQKEIKNYKETIITKRRKGERLIKLVKNLSPLGWMKKK